MRDRKKEQERKKERGCIKFGSLRKFDFRFPGLKIFHTGVKTQRLECVTSKTKGWGGRVNVNTPAPAKYFGGGAYFSMVRSGCVLDLLDLIHIILFQLFIK